MITREHNNALNSSECSIHRTEHCKLVGVALIPQDFQHTDARWRVHRAAATQSVPGCMRSLTGLTLAAFSFAEYFDRMSDHARYFIRLRVLYGATIGQRDENHDAEIGPGHTGHGKESRRNF